MLLLIGVPDWGSSDGAEWHLLVLFRKLCCSPAPNNTPDAVWMFVGEVSKYGDFKFEMMMTRARPLRTLVLYTGLTSVTSYTDLSLALP